MKSQIRLKRETIVWDKIERMIRKLLIEQQNVFIKAIISDRCLTNKIKATKEISDRITMCSQNWIFWHWEATPELCSALYLDGIKKVINEISSLNSFRKRKISSLTRNINPYDTPMRFLESMGLPSTTRNNSDSDNVTVNRNEYEKFRAWYLLIRGGVSLYWLDSMPILNWLTIQPRTTWWVNLMNHERKILKSNTTFTSWNELYWIEIFRILTENENANNTRT